MQLRYNMALHDKFHAEKDLQLDEEDHQLQRCVMMEDGRPLHWNVDVSTRIQSMMPNGTPSIYMCVTFNTSSMGRLYPLPLVVCNFLCIGHHRFSGQCNEYSPMDSDAYIVTDDGGELDHGAIRMVQCSHGYFPTPPLPDTSPVITRCQNGNWSTLPMSCIKPETVDPNAGPSMFIKLLTQLFTGPGMIGIILGILIAIAAVIGVTFSWKFHFQQKAKQNTIDHEERMDHVAKLSTLAQQSSTSQPTNVCGPHSNPSEWSAETDPSDSIKRAKRRHSGQRQMDEDYFGDVELTPVSCSEWDDYTRRNGLMMSDAGDGLTGRTIESFNEGSVTSKTTKELQMNQTRRNSVPSFSQEVLHKTTRRFASDFSPQASDDPAFISTLDCVSTSPLRRDTITTIPTTPRHHLSLRSFYIRRHVCSISESNNKFHGSECPRDVEWLRSRRQRFAQQVHTSNSSNCGTAAAASIQPSSTSSVDNDHTRRLHISQYHVEDESPDMSSAAESVGADCLSFSSISSTS